MCDFFVSFFFTDKLVNDTPKMTSSASQPDLLGGWDSWATGKTASVSATANKPSYTNTGELSNRVWIAFKCSLGVKKKSSNPETSMLVASGAPSISKAKSQTFDPFADLGNLGSNLPGKVSACGYAIGQL